jgi:hypothetical protein
VAQPIRVHPENPKLFEFRGQPRVLLTATEHYGSVMNRPFAYDSYLAEAADKKMTLTRLFMLFRELQGPSNPYSTCKPESPDYIAPFRRVGPRRALDGELRYDLEQPNLEFYERLHRFVSLASDLGIVVEVVLLSNTYAEPIWALNPLHARNNVNGLEEIQWPEVVTRRHPRLFARQVAHVQRIVRELNRYDNVVYEVCNEPGGDVGTPGAPSVAEVNDWLRALAAVVRETEATLPLRHLLCGQEAFAYQPWEQKSDAAFRDFPLDVVNIHPLPNTTYGQRGYDQGAFMSKQLKLQGLRDYCLATYLEPKPLNMDEDNVASQYKDPAGWTIHRKRAWTTLLCGGHYDVIDFSIINYCATGTSASRQHLRTWLKHLSEYVHALDLARARPALQAVRAQPEHTLAAVLAVPGEDYSIYLADARELAEPGAGQALAGELTCDLPEGRYDLAAYSPASGLYSPWCALHGGPGTRLHLPEFREDIVLRLRRRPERGEAT